MRKKTAGSAATCVALSLLLSGVLVGTNPSIAGILDATWTAPITNTDGSPLTDLAFYLVYYGTSASPCPGPASVQVASPTSSPGLNQTTNVRLTGLTTGTVYSVAVTAVDSLGNQSACSGVASAAARTDFAVSPSGTVNFGNVNVGSSLDQVFTVSNTGGGTVSGSTTVAAPFSIVSGSPFTLGGVGTTQTVTVRFTPTTTATVSSTVSFMANGGTTSVIVTGSGTANTDTTPPTITITTPTSSGTYATGNSSLALAGTASDNVGVTRVTWTNSRGGSGTAAGTTNWTASSIALQPGTNGLTVTAQDAAGNTKTASLTVTLSDTTPPSVTMMAPSSGATVSGTITLSATATDNVGIAGVQFKLDGTNLGTEVLAAPYALPWTTTTVPNGTHTLTAVARDAAGNIATSAGVNVNVANNAGLQPSSNGPSFVQRVFSDGPGTRTTAPFSTAAGALLVAFVGSDGPAPGTQSVTVSGAGLSWRLVKRANQQSGTAEIWQATAATSLAGVTVRSTQRVAGYHQSLTVVAFTGAGGIGASVASGAPTGGPSVSVTTTKSGSLVYGVGNDWDRAIARTVGANQQIVHQWADRSTGDTYWVQAAASVISASGTAVLLNVTSPTTDQWNMVAVEILGP